MNRIHRILSLGLIVATMLIPLTARAQQFESDTYSYSDIADVMIASPVVAQITVVKTSRLSKDLSVGVPAGSDRYLVTAKVEALLRGDQGLPERISYLLDQPANQPLKIRKQPFLVGLMLDPARLGMVQLSTPRAQMHWSPTLDRTARSILTELVSPTAPPAIQGISYAFHVQGSLPGESETQIFLRTSSQAPISLNILRRPGEQAQWAVALGELVDDSALPPAAETLLWYRLACGLPSELPPSASAALAPDHAATAARDYAHVLDQLGSCGRSAD